MEPGGGEEGKVNPTFVAARVYFCIYLRTGETREMRANLEHKNHRTCICV